LRTRAAARAFSLSKVPLKVSTNRAAALGAAAMALLGQRDCQHGIAHSGTLAKASAFEVPSCQVHTEPNRIVHLILGEAHDLAGCDCRAKDAEHHVRARALQGSSKRI